MHTTAGNLRGRQQLRDLSWFEDNIKINITEIGCESVDCINFAQYKVE
jgi:hypothetical protein